MRDTNMSRIRGLTKVRQILEGIEEEQSELPKSASYMDASEIGKSEITSPDPNRDTMNVEMGKDFMSLIK